jgi:hypothetical protein
MAKLALAPSNPERVLGGDAYCPADADGRPMSGTQASI